MSTWPRCTAISFMCIPVTSLSWFFIRSRYTPFIISFMTRLDCRNLRGSFFSGLFLMTSGWIDDVLRAVIKPRLGTDEEPLVLAWRVWALIAATPSAENFRRPSSCPGRGASRWLLFKGIYPTFNHVKENSSLVFYSDAQFQVQQWCCLPCCFCCGVPMGR